MAKSDIFLRENRVSVVGGDGQEVAGGREQGDLEVTIGEDKDPSVTLNADRANVTLGGGAGSAPEGDIKLLDQGGTQRVQISAEHDETSGGAYETKKDNSVTIDGGAGSIALANPGNEYGTVEPAAEIAPGRLNLAKPGSNTPNTTIDAFTGDIKLAGPRGESGRIVLEDEEGEDTVTVAANADDRDKGARIRAGGVDLYTSVAQQSRAGGFAEFLDGDIAGVEIHGPTASVHVGYSFSDIPDGDVGDSSGTQLPVTGGTPGSIHLDDGNPGNYLPNSRVFEVRASEGSLQVSTENSRLFEIDPSDKKIKYPSNWELDDSLPKYNP